jgi:hypothetical protein
LTNLVTLAADKIVSFFSKSFKTIDSLFQGNSFSPKKGERERVQQTKGLHTPGSGTDVMILKIFSPKHFAKNGVFSKYCYFRKIWIITLVCRKRQFFRRK